MASKGLLKSKQRLFQTEPAMPERRKSANIRQAENGFVVDCDGPDSYDGKPKIATSVAGVLKILKEHFGDSSSDEKDDE